MAGRSSAYPKPCSMVGDTDLCADLLFSNRTATAAARGSCASLRVKGSEVSDFGTAWRRPLSLSGHAEWLRGSSREGRAGGSQR